jgi:hypothetical protein
MGLQKADCSKTHQEILDRKQDTTKRMEVQSVTEILFVGSSRQVTNDRSANWTIVPLGLGGGEGEGLHFAVPSDTSPQFHSNGFQIYLPTYLLHGAGWYLKTW